MTTGTLAHDSDSSLQAAKGYSKSADILMKYIGQTRSADVIGSMIVLRSLALEIYLKRLYAIESGQSYEGHHVKQIFDALSEGSRQKIRDDYEQRLANSGFIKQTHAKHLAMKGEPPKLDFDHMLHEWAEAIAEWRRTDEPESRVAFLAF